MTKTQFKEDVMGYLDQRIKKQKNLIRLAQERQNRTLENTQKYGLEMLRTIKTEILLEKNLSVLGHTQPTKEWKLRVSDWWEKGQIGKFKTTNK